jgi:hypothetical protein
MASDRFRGYTIIGVNPWQSLASIREKKELLEQ